MDVTRRSRTCAPRPRAAHHPVENGLRLLTKVLRDVVTQRRFTSYTDLKDAYLTRVRELRIRYAQADFDDAYSLVGSNRTLVHVAAAAPRRQDPPAPRPISRHEAQDLLAQMPGIALKAMSSAANSPINIYGPIPRENWEDHDRS